MFLRAKRLFAGGPVVATSHPSLWQEISTAGSNRRVKVLKVKAHLSQEAFLTKYGQEHLWMHKANSVANELNSARASTLVHAQSDILHRWADGRAQKLLSFQVAVLRSVQDQMPKRPKKAKAAHSPKPKPWLLIVRRAIFGS